MDDLRQMTFDDLESQEADQAAVLADAHHTVVDKYDLVGSAL